MNHSIPGWTLQYLTNKFFFVGIPICFICLNAIAVGFSAKPRKPHAIPRFWWPVITVLVFGGAFVYWLCFWGLQKSFTYQNSTTTIGRLIGFEIIVYDETDPAPPDEMKASLAQSRLDGTRR